MTEHRDQLLQTLFSEAQRELDGEALTARVMAKTRSLRYRRVATWVLSAVILLVSTWMVFAIPLQEFVVLVAQGLSTTLLDLGEGWLAWVFSPVNNIASLLVITVKAIRIFQKKIIGVSFA
jgi:hypothetical protein